MSNPYAIDSIACNPYFQMAYNSPNFYGVGASQVVPTTTADITTTTENKPAAKPEAEKKDNSTAKLILGTVAVVGAGLLCKKAYKMGETGKGFWKQLGSGFKKMGSKTVNWGKEVKDKVTNNNVFSVRQENGRTLCTVPGKTNRLTAAQAMQELGVTDAVPNLTETTSSGITKLAEGIKLGKGTLTLTDGTTCIVKDGKIIKSSQSLEHASEAIRNEAHSLLEKFKRGESAPEINYRQFTHTENGFTRIFKKDANGDYKLTNVVSEKFNLNSDVVKEFRGANQKADNALKEYFTNGSTEGLKIARAEIPTSEGILISENGNIIGIKIGNNTYKKGETKYNSLIYDYNEIYDKAIQDKNSYTNVVYQLA